MMSIFPRCFEVAPFDRGVYVNDSEARRADLCASTFCTLRLYNESAETPASGTEQVWTMMKIYNMTPW